jgi:metallo-beta-lactamase family protein
MQITLCGAAGEVTGSGYLIETGDARVLVDFGMFQGIGASYAKNKSLEPVAPARLDAIVLSHAHLDHCGRLPLLFKEGYTGSIHATEASTQMAELMLRDAAQLEQSEVARRNRKLQRQGRQLQEPLYVPADVDPVLSSFRSLPYGEARAIAPGVRVRFQDAGHMLGSASVELQVDGSAGEPRTLIFSGDLGPRGRPLLRDPVPFERGDLVFLESTYGDRDHRPLDATVEEFRRLIQEAITASQRVLIPAFAVGRTQLVLYYLAELARDGLLGDVPVYLDSPMAIKATELYRTNVDLLDEELMGGLRTRSAVQQMLTRVKPLLTSEESRSLNESWDPAIIIAGSGMCDGGRIQHHLKHNLWRKGVVVMIMGYQGAGTLGRQLVDGAREVRIHGSRVVVRAKIATLGGFSGHADQSELLDWLAPLAGSRPRVILTHGEDKARSILRQVIRARFGIDAQCPGPGAVLEFH